MYEANPSRACGSKQPNAFYAEGGDLGATGALHVWSWLLGDGLGKNILMEVSPRQMEMINPIMTIYTQSKVLLGGPDIPVLEDDVWKIEKLTEATKDVGLADHVGKNNYSVYSFAQEVLQFGPSRRIPRNVAETLADILQTHGPIPMMFTHDRVPQFRSIGERDNAIFWMLAAVNEIGYTADQEKADEMLGEYLGSRVTIPTWEHDNWGQYARRDHWRGQSHYLIPLLAFIHEIENNWSEHKDQDIWKDAREYFKSLHYVEQTFGMSWLLRVTYTLPDDGEIDEEILDIPGINVIDLNEEDAENETAEQETLGVN